MNQEDLVAELEATIAQLRSMPLSALIRLQQSLPSARAPSAFFWLRTLVDKELERRGSSAA
jgi:hypothetical protein